MGRAAPARMVPWGWMALIGCAFAAGVLWSLVEVNRSNERNEGLVEEAIGILDKEREEEMEAEKTIEAIEKAVRQFFDSRSVDELLKYVRHPKRVEPLMENYYATDPFVPRRVERILSFDPLTIDNHANFWMVLCELSDGSNGQVLTEVLSGSVAKVDWETFVCYQPVEWDEFAKKRPPGYSGDFRVYAESDNYHTYQFSDSETYAAYRLTALDSEEVLYGYVERGTSLAEELEMLAPAGAGRAVPLILRLEVPRIGMSKRGLHVRELVCARWMYVESPEVGP